MALDHPYRERPRVPRRPWRFIVRGWRFQTRRRRWLLWLVGAVACVAAVLLAMFAMWMSLINSYRRREPEQAARVIRSAVNLFRNDHPKECPTLADLVREGILDRNQRTVDPWGHAFHIKCDGDEIVVWSDGRDGRSGTADDVPPPK